MRAKGIDFIAKHATPEQIEQFQAEGHNAFPVVVVDCGDGATWSWSGFRFDNITKLAEDIVSAA